MFFNHLDYITGIRCPEEVFAFVKEKISKKVNLTSDIINKAESFYRNRKGTRDKWAFALASFYTALKISDCQPIDVNTLVSTLIEEMPSNINFERYFRKEVCRYYRKMWEQMGRPTPKECYAQPYMYIRKYGEMLGLDRRDLGFAMRLAHEVVKRRLHIGRAQNIVAAAILYIAGLERDLPIFQHKLKQIACCTPVAIRANYRYILKRLKDVCPTAYQMAREWGEWGDTM